MPTINNIITIIYFISIGLLKKKTINLKLKCGSKNLWYHIYTSIIKECGFGYCWSIYIRCLRYKWWYILKSGAFFKYRLEVYIDVENRVLLVKGTTFLSSYWGYYASRYVNVSILTDLLDPLNPHASRWVDAFFLAKLSLKWKRP
jgi:hypothetical protein